MDRAVSILDVLIDVENSIFAGSGVDASMMTSD